MISYAQLRPGRGFVPGHAIAYFVQRFITNLTMRRCISNLLAARVRRRHSTFAMPSEADLQPALCELARDGIVMRPNLFSMVELNDMVAYFQSKQVLTPDAGYADYDNLPVGTTLAAYDLATVVGCPWLMDAINRTDALRLASAYLGCKPTLSGVGVRWSFPGSASTVVTQAFHRDPDDWRFLKLFVYLTDVDLEGGPHTYVAGSHRTPRALRAKTYAPEQLEARFGKESMRAILGARGTTFVADTSGIHAGIPPKRAPRLLLQVQYSILPNFALDYRPIADPTHRHLDAYVNRLILASTGM